MTPLKPTDITETKILAPHQLAWMRRSDLDEKFRGEVWELPDGRVYLHDPTQGPLRLTFTRIPKMMRRE